MKSIKTKKPKTLPRLKAELQKVFNEYIRQRDKDKPCISCGQFKDLQAGHFYSVRNYDGLRFDEDNVHGECVRCNCFDDDHLIGYSVNLVRKIGPERFVRLQERAMNYKKNGKKWSRSELEEMITKYKDETNIQNRN